VKNKKITIQNNYYISGPPLWVRVENRAGLFGSGRVRV